jgi:hypothetical protein
MPDKAHQKIQGVKVTPKNASTKRFPQWGISEAFGGWIFSCNVQIGFSDSPTEIKLEIVLENDAQDLTTLIPKVFDIKPEDLNCGAGTGGSSKEHLFDLSIGGKKFTDFVLFDYNINLSPEQKTLSVTFKDYSIILDKIYIGLLKRQGALFYNTYNAQGYFPVACPECDFRITIGNGTMYRDISYCSYVGINGKVYNNFEGENDLYISWNNLSNKKLEPSFDLNGGYLILGTEEMYENQCEDLPTVSYTFRDLINSLTARGFVFTGAFNKSVANNIFYKQSYIGTLREVLNNWCSDLAIQFHADGKIINGIDLNQEIDIKDITEIADPKSKLGKLLDGQNIALGSYSENYTLSNTYRQSVIVSNVSQRHKREESFDIKNFVKLVPMHPLDFVSPNFRNHSDGLGQMIANRFGTTDVTDKYITNLSSRSIDEIDTAMALAKYDESLRDIYVGQKLREAYIARYSNSNTPQSRDNAAVDMGRYADALGFIIVTKFVDTDSKSLILESCLGQEDSKQITYHPDFYDIYLGYYYPSAHREIIDYEKNAAESMYKYATLNRGTIAQAPFVQQDISSFKNSNDEYYIERGGFSVQVKNTFQPNAERYSNLSEAPYYNLLPRRVTDFPNNLLYVAQIENEWGTATDDFRSAIYDPLVPFCDQAFSNIASFGQLYYYGTNNEDVPKRQSWDLKLFAPTFHSDLSKIYDYVNEISSLSPQTQDEVNISLAGLDNKYRKDCKKLHICIIPNTKTHPNIRVAFEKNGYYSATNTVLADQINKRLDDAQKNSNTATNKVKDICDLSPVTVACEQITKCSVADNSANLYAGWPTCYFNSGNGQFSNGVPNIVTPNNYKQGSLGKLSRSLKVSVTRNPSLVINGQGTDGSYYYSDVLLDDIDFRLQTSKSSATIVYPASNDPADYDLSYIGVLDAQVHKEIKIPSSWELYGAPVNTADNNTSSIKVINQLIPNDLKTIIDPQSMKPVRFTIVNTGSNVQVLARIYDYYNIISSLNSYQSVFTNKSVDFSIIGSPDLINGFSSYVNPISGLNQFTMSIKDQGVETSFSYSNKPRVLPKQEVIINSIGPRMMAFTV